MEEITEYIDYIHYIHINKLNYSLVIYFIMGPLLIFYKKPDMSSVKRFWITAFAVFLSCLLLTMTNIEQESTRYKLFKECRKIYENCMIKNPNISYFSNICKPYCNEEVDKVDGKTISSYIINKLSFSYITSIAESIPDLLFDNITDISFTSFVSLISNIVKILSSIIITIAFSPTMALPELLWRIYHQRKIKAMGDEFRGKWFSNFTILSILILIISAPIFFYINKFNYFAFLYLTVGPLIIFYKKPDMSSKARNTIIIFAVFLSCVLFLLMIIKQHDLYWDARYKCYDKYPSLKNCNEICDKEVEYLKRLNLFSFILIIANPFMGLPELGWRIYHRKKIEALGKDFKGKWFSNVIISMILLFIPVVILVIGFIIKITVVLV